MDSLDKLINRAVDAAFTYGDEGQEDNHQDMEAAKQTLKEAVGKLVAALEQYADEANWSMTENHVALDEQIVWTGAAPGFEVARKVLEEE